MGKASSHYNKTQKAGSPHKKAKKATASDEGEPKVLNDKVSTIKGALILDPDVL